MPFVFAMLWASSYASSAIGLRDISPVVFVAIRLLAAAAIALTVVAILPRFTIPGPRQWPHLLVGGALVHGLTLSAAHAALLTVKAAPLGLVHAFHPVLTAALAVPLLGERFSARQWLGFAIGFAGVLLVLSADRISPHALVLMALSMAGLTGGTLYLKRFTAGVPPFEGTAVQLAGGAGLTLAAIPLDAPFVHWTAPLAAMMAWNVLAVSILGMLIYTTMIVRGEAGRAASAFFIVPGGAALFGYLFLHQGLSPLALLGLAIASFGVWLVWRKPRAGAA